MWRMSDCITELRFRPTALILLFILPIFLFFFFSYVVHIDFFYQAIEARILANLAYIRAMSSFVGLKIGLIALIFFLYLSSFLSFEDKFVSQFSQNLCELES